MADKPIVPPTPLPESPPVPQRNDPATFEDRFDAGWEYMFEVLRPGIDATAENVYENALAAEERAVAADERATDAESAKQAAEDARDKAQEWAEGVEPEPGSKSAKAWAENSKEYRDGAEAYRDGAAVLAAAAGAAAGTPSMVGQEGKALFVTPGLNPGDPPIPAWLFPGAADFQEFTASAVWEKKDGAKFVYVEAIGGGASGQAVVSSSSSSSSRGGDGGMFISRLFLADDLPETITVTIGAGGARKTHTGIGGLTPGDPGGTSSFGSFLNAPGGGSTQLSTMFVDSASRGSSDSSFGINVKSRDSVNGGAAGANATTNSGTSPVINPGGVSQFAGKGGDGVYQGYSQNSNGEDGVAPGGGGGAAFCYTDGITVTARSGAGARGVVRVWCW